jgi:hypothetical protein
VITDGTVLGLNWGANTRQQRGNRRQLLLRQRRCFGDEPVRLGDLLWGEPRFELLESQLVRIPLFRWYFADRGVAPNTDTSVESGAGAGLG